MRLHVAIPLLLVAAVTCAAPATAICTKAYLIQAKPVVSNPALPDAPYIYTEGGGAATGPRFRATFWSLGGGDPELGAGDDQGGFDSREWSVTYYTPDYGGYARATRLEVVQPKGALTWAASDRIDGCVSSPAPGQARCTCLMLEDGWEDGSYFALLADGDDIQQNFDFGQWTPGDVTRLVRIPGPRVTAMRPAADGNARVSVELDEFEGGIYADPDCGACATVSFAVTQALVPRRTAEPKDRIVGAAYTVVPGQPPAGTPAGQSIELTTGCGDAEHDVWLAIQLRFDSGFATRYVSGDAWRLHCDTDVSRPVRPTTRIKPAAGRDDGEARELRRRQR